MKQVITTVLVLFSVATGMGQLVAAQSPQPRASAKEKLIAHGKYLVQGAAPWGDCHTLRNQRGELVQEKALQGLPFCSSPRYPCQSGLTERRTSPGCPGGPMSSD